MAKRQLLNWMRDKLLTHVNAKVEPTKEKKKMDTTYAKLAPMVTRLVEAKFKPADMAVLAKYSVAKRDDCINITLPDARVVNFNFRKDEGPMVAMQRNCHGRMYLGDDRLAAAFTQHAAAVSAYTDERERRIAAYAALVRNARFVEDVVEVWPEAAALLPATVVMAPLAPEQIALIRADTVDRKAA